MPLAEPYLKEDVEVKSHSFLSSTPDGGQPPYPLNRRLIGYVSRPHVVAKWKYMFLSDI
jgi:hypothetical protein